MIHPSRGYILIEPDKAEEQNASGLYVPDSAQDKPKKGTVIATGQAFLWSKAINGAIPAPCRVGDWVYFRPWAGENITEDGIEYQIVKFEDILGVIER